MSRRRKDATSENRELEANAVTEEARVETEDDADARARAEIEAKLELIASKALEREERISRREKELDAQRATLDEREKDLDKRETELKSFEARLKGREKKLSDNEASMLQWRRELEGQDFEIKKKVSKLEEELTQKRMEARDAADKIIRRAEEAEKEANKLLAEAKMKALTIEGSAKDPEVGQDDGSLVARTKREAWAEVSKARAEAEEAQRLTREAEKTAKAIEQAGLRKKAEVEAQIEMIVAEADRELAKVRAKKAGLEALEVDYFRTMNLPEEVKRQFLMLANEPSLSRRAVAERMELYAQVYPSFSIHTVNVPPEGFELKRTKHIQNAGEFSIKWRPSDGKEPLAGPEAEALLRVLAARAAYDLREKSGVFELWFVDKKKLEAKDLLRVLLPGLKAYLSQYRTMADVAVSWSVSGALAQTREKYPEEYGWSGGMNGKYRYGRLAVRSGCFVFSFAADYHPKVEREAVLGTLIAVATALSRFAEARGELDEPLRELPNRPALSAVIQCVGEEFEELSYPEIYGWNAWVRDFKPTRWKGGQSVG